MNDEPKREQLAERFADDAAVDEAIKRAVRTTLDRHRRLGHSIVVWRDGQAVWLPAREIPVEPTPREEKP